MNWEGLEIRLIKHLSELLGFTYELKETKRDMYDPLYTCSINNFRQYTVASRQYFMVTCIWAHELNNVKSQCQYV